MDIAEFLNARLDEADAAMVDGECRCQDDGDDAYRPDCPAFILADIAAKRAIIEAHPMETWYTEAVTGCTVCHEDYSWGPDLVEGPCPTLRHLGSVYSDHPDYDKSWKPSV